MGIGQYSKNEPVYIASTQSSRVDYACVAIYLYSWFGGERNSDMESCCSPFSTGREEGGEARHIGLVGRHFCSYSPIM
jgi:hypothetical protein